MATRNSSPSTSMSSPPATPTTVTTPRAPAYPSERVLLLLVGAVQFVNVIDFMMVMPLGPDFARALGIPTSQLGYIGGSYTLAAAVVGLVGSLFLDRFDRRSALACSMLGLVAGTLAGAAAWDFSSLLVARILAGCFGGPASSLCLSIVADVVPAERRGRAMGTVMSAWAVASVLGVPAGLELARAMGWRAPFVAVGLLGLIVAGLAIWFLPSLKGHMDSGSTRPGIVGTVGILMRPEAALALATTMAMMVSGFVVVPNLSAYVQYNAGYPREHMGRLYMVGGLLSLISMRLAGVLVDRLGPTMTCLGGTVIFVGNVILGLVYPPGTVPVMFFFAAWMVSSSFRHVPAGTQATRVPRPHQRAGFMSLQSAVQHLSAAIGSFLSSAMLTEGPGHKLIGMRSVALVSMGASMTIPVFVSLVETALSRRAAIEKSEEVLDVP